MHSHQNPLPHPCLHSISASGICINPSEQQQYTPTVSHNTVLSASKRLPSRARGEPTLEARTRHAKSGVLTALIDTQHPRDCQRSAMESGEPPGRVFMVAGHQVQFPHAAYGTQFGFMNKARASGPNQADRDMISTLYQVTRQSYHSSSLHPPHTCFHPSCVPDLSAISPL